MSKLSSATDQQQSITADVEANFSQHRSNSVKERTVPYKQMRTVLERSLI